MKKIDFLCVSSDQIILNRCQEIARDFNYSFVAINSIDELMERETEFKDVTFIVLTCMNANQSEVAGNVQVARQIFTSAPILTVVDSKLSPENAAFIKKSGASVVVQEQEVLHTSKLEFIAAQRIRSSYVPIKANELMPNTKIECDLYHLMPLNKKFLPVVKANVLLEAAKLQKISEAGEVYIRREDLGAYRKYANEIQDPTAQGLARRCRAQFLELTAGYTDLILLVADQSEYASFEKGKALYDSCEKMAGDLLMNLAALGNSWDIVNNSAVGEFGSVERGPALAAYAGLLSLNANIGDAKQVMLASLFADVGMLDLHPKVTKKIRDLEEDKMHAEDLQYYHNHPVTSINMALGRRLPLPDRMKAIVVNTHERYDRKGFPKRPRPEDIPLEAYLIQFCELVDRASIIRMGKQRVTVGEAMQKIFAEEVSRTDRFSIVFLETIRKHLAV